MNNITTGRKYRFHTTDLLGDCRPFYGVTSGIHPRLTSRDVTRPRQGSIPEGGQVGSSEVSDPNSEVTYSQL